MQQSVRLYRALFLQRCISFSLQSSPWRVLTAIKLMFLELCVVKCDSSEVESLCIALDKPQKLAAVLLLLLWG